VPGELFDVVEGVPDRDTTCGLIRSSVRMSEAALCPRAVSERRTGVLPKPTVTVALNRPLASAWTVTTFVPLAPRSRVTVARR
jgi:hypothetical protein